jgi:hypothetical protein
VAEVRLHFFEQFEAAEAERKRARLAANRRALAEFVTHLELVEKRRQRGLAGRPQW